MRPSKKLLDSTGIRSFCPKGPRRKPSFISRDEGQTSSHRRSAMRFVFATGIENSYPTIKHGTHRVDEMQKCGHYEHWSRDFDLVEEMGILWLRYGPPLHTTWTGPVSYDWSFADETMADLKRRGIEPIVDLCHFGVPDFIGDFQNTDFPDLFYNYAFAFAQRFPWVRYYTPVNEMFVCAKFSGHYGWWNEQGTTDKTFVTALINMVKANRLAMEAIRAVRPDAIFIQAESAEQFHAENVAAIEATEHRNQQRFLSLDLNYGVDVSGTMYQFLRDNGLSAELYAWFMQGADNRNCVVGTDYYYTNEHSVRANGLTCGAGEVFGYAEIVRQYYDRYRLPIMHTETNLSDHAGGATRWLEKQFTNVLRLRQTGIPMLGFTWYSLTDQVDWNTALREDNGFVCDLGLYDLDRKIRPVGKAYKAMIKEWAPHLIGHHLANVA